MKNEEKNAHQLGILDSGYKVVSFFFSFPLSHILQLKDGEAGNVEIPIHADKKGPSKVISI